MHPAFSPHPIPDFNPEEKNAQCCSSHGTSTDCSPPGSWKQPADTSLPESTPWSTRVDSEPMARCPSKCTGVCAGAVSACWEPVRHGATPPDTPHTWGPDHKAAGVWQLLNGNEIFVAPEKRRQQSSGQPHAGPICFSLVPSMQQTGRLGPRTSNASAVYGGCWLFFLLPPPPHRPRSPLASRSCPGP